jgi:hypothetical protein
MKPVRLGWVVTSFVLCICMFAFTYVFVWQPVFGWQSTDPVLVGAGDIASCSNTGDSATATLLDTIAGTVFTLGDNVYPNGAATEFTNCYHPTWGRHKGRTRPAPGNHDYQTSGAAGYYTYFGAAASPLDTNCQSNCKGYYAYDLGAWHIIVLNSEISVGAGSAQEQWLRQDLAAHANVCTLAYWHKPRFSSGEHGNTSSMQALWQALYDYRADVVLSGHDHTYERFAPQTPGGQADPQRGIRQFVVGTGGASLYNFPTVQPNSEVRNNSARGVLKLTLHAQSYDWEFVPVSGQTFRDTGSSACVGAGSATSTPTRTPTRVPVSTPTSTPTSAPATDLIFADSFEAGNLAAWSASQTDGGDLSVSTAAKLVGNQGMQANLDDNIGIYVTDDRPNAEARYQAAFYVDPNSMAMANLDTHNIFLGYAGASTTVLRIELRRATGYVVRIGLLNDATTWRISSWYTISDAPHRLLVDWQAATAAGANNGRMTLWIDGQQKVSLTGVDNDTRRIDRVRLGAISAIDTGTRGVYYFDAFESRRTTLTGAMLSGEMLTATVTAEGGSSVTETLESAVEATTLPLTLLATQVQPTGEQPLATVIDALPVEVAFGENSSGTPITVGVSASALDMLPDGYALVGGIFGVTFADTQGAPLALVAPPLLVTAHYGPLLSGGEQTITVQRWHAELEQWEVLPATIDNAAQTISIGLDGPATLALFQLESETTHSLYLPLIRQ